MILSHLYNSKYKDVFSKNVNNDQKDNSFSKFDTLILAIHVQKIDKIYDYFVLQSICLIDTISAQKPKLKTMKCKYTFGSRAFSFSCKVTLRKRKFYNFISVMNFVVLSEMERRHLQISSNFNSYETNNIKANTNINKVLFSFSVKNTNVFYKLDEFYFKWNYPIIFSFNNQTEIDDIKLTSSPLPIG